MVVGFSVKAGVMKTSTFLLKRGRARRALSLLGVNNVKLNIRLAETLLTISSEEFAKKWNFDPVQGVPLPEGRFQWTPVASSTTDSAADDKAFEKIPSRTSDDQTRPWTNSMEQPQPAPGVTQPASDETKVDCAISVESSRHTSCGACALAPCNNSPGRCSATPPREGNDGDAEEGPRVLAQAIKDTKLKQTCITDFMRTRKRRSSPLDLKLQKPLKKQLLQIRA
ncbi:uncharacterized protein LOC135214589 [Macrobrachium nipponense]|uniref:uncharacterized protein LOC135214589 n=1 Tax=Macrobrachium nipponense TaxID=159736 RepID=UPI0030C8129E